MRWEGFRKVRGQVCKRITRRISFLGCDTVEGYRQYLREHPEEWKALEALCYVTISRFYRDREVFRRLGQDLFPLLLRRVRDRGEEELRCCSIGCASGEEPYTVVLQWSFLYEPEFSDLNLSIFAFDIDENVLERARTGCYSLSTLRELPPDWIDQAFRRSDDLYCLKDAFKSRAVFLQEDVRNGLSERGFDLVLCRNLVFTYFKETLQKRCLEDLGSSMNTGGFLIIGKKEELPYIPGRFQPWDEKNRIFFRV